MSDSVPAHARVVVIGGGIAGCSVAYHLTKLGWRDVVLLERRELSCGTTWHAAGLVGQLRATHNLTRLARYGADLYEKLEAETGQATGFRRPGSLSLARTPERMHELARLASMARCFDVEAEVITPAEAGRRWPLIRTDDLAGAVWLPRDGRTNPIDTTLALAKGARQCGATILENTAVTAIRTRGGGVAGVATTRGEIACEVVVNCAGMWARELGAMAGVAVPLHASEHFYMVTEPMPGVTSDLPVLRDPDGYIYVREEVGGLLMGGFEPVAKPWGMAGIPADFSFSLLPEDWDHFQVLMEQAIIRIPRLETAPVRRHVNGPESFTPDGRYHLGEAPECRNFFVAAGFNSIGIASGAGAGKAVAEWIVGGEPPMDLGDVDIRRVAPFQANPTYLRERTVEMVGRLYAMHWPFQQAVTSRGVRKSVLHERLAARGACFGEVMGWERANWYAAPGQEPVYRYSWGRQNWFPQAAEEHRAVREAVGVFDQSSFAKFRLEGPDAAAALGRLCAGDVDVPVGRIVYTQMLNRHGGIECDLTVTRLAEDAYLIVTAAAAATHDAAWIRRNLGEARAVLTDVTAVTAVLGVMGPHSRALLARLTDADLSNTTFPFLHSREVWLASAPVRASRITYVGSSAGSSTYPRSLPRASTMPWSRRDRAWASAMPAITPWIPSASRRHIATGGTTSVRRTRRSRRVSASQSGSTSPHPSSAARRSWPSARSRSHADWRSSCWTTRRRCSTTTSRSGATARWWDASLRVPTATRSAGRWGSATSSTPTAPRMRSWRAGAGSSRSPANDGPRKRS